MKTNIRILSFVLALVICLSSAVIAVSAEDNTVQPNQMYKDIVFKALGWDASSDEYLYNFIMAYNADGATMDEGVTPDYIVAFASVNEFSTAEKYRIVGDYKFYSPNIYSPYDIGYMIYSTKEEKCYSFVEAYRLELPYIESVFERLGTRVSIYSKTFEEYLKPYVVDMDFFEDWYFHENWYFYDELYYYDNSTGGTIEFPEATPDYVLAKANTYFASPLLFYDVFGEYIIHGSCGDPYCASYYIYLPESDKIYTLREAFDENTDGIEKVFTDYKLGNLMGDADGDRKLTIKDATCIQKCLANFEGFKLKDEIRGHNLSVADDGTPDPYVCYIEDFNNDDQVNIKDATAIQKRLAKIDI